MKVKFLKKEKKFKKETLHISPIFYWKIAVLMLFFVFILSFGFGYYLFTKINQEPDVSNISGDAQVKTIKKERIQNILDYFYERGQKSEEIINSPAPVIDPSL